MIIKSKILFPFLILISTFLLTPINAAAAPKSMEYQEVKLMLNGEGTRVRFFMKVYNTSLYLISAIQMLKKYSIAMRLWLFVLT